MLLLLLLPSSPLSDDRGTDLFRALVEDVPFGAGVVVLEDFSDITDSDKDLYRVSGGGVE
jgi:hypothetical protein